MDKLRASEQAYMWIQIYCYKITEHNKTLSHSDNVAWEDSVMVKIMKMAMKARVYLSLVLEMNWPYNIEL
jgi:hypothetical protein